VISGKYKYMNTSTAHNIKLYIISVKTSLYPAGRYYARLEKDAEIFEITKSFKS